jgi:hypothetical protein
MKHTLSAVQLVQIAGQLELPGGVTALQVDPLPPPVALASPPVALASPPVDVPPIPPLGRPPPLPPIPEPPPTPVLASPPIPDVPPLPSTLGPSPPDAPAPSDVASLVLASGAPPVPPVPMPAPPTPGLPTLKASKSCVQEEKSATVQTSTMARTCATLCIAAFMWQVGACRAMRRARRVRRAWKALRAAR